MSGTPTPERRPAGRPRVMDKPARLWLRVDEEHKQAAERRAKEDGHPDLTTAIRELVHAYAEGRVTVRRPRGNR